MKKNSKVNALVRIDGKKVKRFVSLNITQEYGQHHTFAIKLYADELFGKGFMYNPAEQMELIGKRIVIDLQHGDNNRDAYIFKGVITNMGMLSAEGNHEYLLLKGFSPTKMLDRGKRMDIYSELTLRQIFKKLTEGVRDEYMPHVNAPSYKTKIDFVMQYDETDWEFLQRLAYLYGENLFFSGSEILFGDYEEWEPVKLMYDVDILSLEFGTKLIANNSTAYQYLPEQNTFLDKSLPERIEGANEYVEQIDELNSILTSGKPVKNQIAAHIDTGAEMTELLKREKVRTAAETVYVKGTANTYQTTIGRLVTVRLPEKYTKTRSVGTYRVIKSVHNFDEKEGVSVYTNTFEAVPASLKTMPVEKPPMPIAQGIIGEVRNTDDPQGIGRVQVDFKFAKQYNRLWLRVLSPNAGSSGAVSKNRGMMFIPEVGDQVMINFEYGDPNRPYVAGSMWHSDNSSGGGAKNHIKSIITRSGIKIELDDAQQSVHIEDPSGNVWNMNGKGVVTVNAPKRFVINSDDVEINARQNINIKAGNNLLSDAGNSYGVYARTLKNVVSQDMQLVSANTLISSTYNMQLQADDICALGESQVQLHSDCLIDINSKGTVDMKSDNEVSLGQDATENERVVTEEIAIAVVDFRQRTRDARTFGFDWMRVDNEGLLITRIFQNSIESGVERIITNEDGTPSVQEFATREAAFEGLQEEYTFIPIRPAPDAPPDTDERKYYPARITLFPTTADTSHAIPESQPVTEVELELFVEIMQEIDRLELQFNTDYFELPDREDNIIPLSSHTPQAKARSETTVRIRCIEEFAEQQEIRVWAIPHTNTDAGSEASRFLAGKLLALPNANRRPMRVALVQVVTDVRGTGSEARGSFHNRAATIEIQNFMHQALIECTVLTRPENQPENNNPNDNFILDLSNVGDYRATGGGTGLARFIVWHHNLLRDAREALGQLRNVASRGGEPCQELFNDLRRRFGEQYPDYRDCYLVFSFGIDLHLNFAGMAQGIGNKVVIVSSSRGGRVQPDAIAHELFHLLGLKHTFRDILDRYDRHTLSDRQQIAPLVPEQRFVFRKYRQDNIMDYSGEISRGGVPRKTRTFFWQWDKVHRILDTRRQEEQQQEEQEGQQQTINNEK